MSPTQIVPATVSAEDITSVKSFQVLCLGDKIAASLGVHTKALRVAASICASASAGAAVSFTELLGFVGPCCSTHYKTAVWRRNGLSTCNIRNMRNNITALGRFSRTCCSRTNGDTGGHYYGIPGCSVPVPTSSKKGLDIIMLECIDLTSSYAGIPIIEHIHFQLPINQLTVVLGKNGAGKSTLLSCLQQQQPYLGTIYLNGINIQKYTPQQLATQISFLPQALPCPDVTVGELTSFGRRPYLGTNRRHSQKDISAISNALELTGMTDYFFRILSTLSGGEKQQAFLSMILTQVTDILSQ